MFGDDLPPAHCAFLRALSDDEWRLPLAVTVMPNLYIAAQDCVGRGFAEERDGGWGYRRTPAGRAALAEATKAGVQP